MSNLSTGIESNNQINLKQPKKFKWTRGKVELLLMTIPSLIFVLVFAYFPLFGYVYAFFDYQIGMKLSQCTFRGFHYFQIALSDPGMLNALKNTLIINGLGLLGIPIACAFAILLTELKGKTFKKMVQTASTLPNFISWVIVFSIFFSLFAPDSGVVNEVLLKLHIIKQPLNPLADSSITWFFQPAIAIWKSTGYSAIVFFAALAGIDTELYDAAMVDGCGRWKKIRYITIPSLYPTLFVVFIMALSFILGIGFEQYYVFNNPMVQNKIQVLDLYVYNMGLGNNDIPTATALSIVKTFLSLGILFSVNRISKKLRGVSMV